jgi:hypothetical protein
MQGADFDDEVSAVENVKRAYLRARREVFDVEHADSPQLSQRQRQLLVELEVAEAELRILRARRRAES